MQHFSRELLPKPQTHAAAASPGAKANIKLCSYHEILPLQTSLSLLNAGKSRSCVREILFLPPEGEDHTVLIVPLPESETWMQNGQEAVADFG